MTNRATGWAAQKDQYAVPVMFNPYTGEPRDVRDVQSDPQGILIAPPGRVEMLAATPPAQAADSVLEDAARLDWLESNSQTNIERVRYLGATKSIYEVTPYDSASYDGETLRAAIDAARKQGGAI